MEADKYPKISIVTPSFNQAHFIEQTICSVLNQNYPNLEYIIMDGGSTDGTVDIIKKYADKITYWESEPDAGQYDAINKGFQRTSGEIMSWINSSDVYYPWTFQLLGEVFKQFQDVKWITGVATHLNETYAPRSVDKGTKNVYDFLSGNYAWLQQESIFWHRSLWDTTGSNINTQVKYAGDFELWLRFFKHAKLYHFNSILGGFRYHDNRRGEDIAGIYKQEAEKLFKEFYESYSLSDKVRGKLISLTDNPPGRIIRSFMKKIGLWQWYNFPLIRFDFQKGMWKILE